MPSKLIKLEDGVFVEVEVPEKQSRQLSGKFADKVKANIDKIKPVLTSVVQPILETWDEVNQKMNVEQAEAELGLSFDLEGNLYITKVSAAANLTIRLVLKPKETQTKDTQTSGTP